ncbi:MAG: SMP-30/gluconolactonase/LRE family protein [Chloroflexota bacterium]
MTRHADERAGHGLTSRRTLIKGIVALAGAVMMAPAGVPTVAQAQTPGSTGNEPPVQPPTTITNPPRDFGPNGAPTTYFADPDVITIDPAFNNLRVGNTSIKRLWTGALWAEGPAWNSVGRFLIFSDIAANRQMRWLEENGEVSVFRDPSNNSNGNSFDWQGRQVSAEHVTRRVVRYEHDGTTTIIADSYQGKHLNSPNDMAHHSDGSIWFTDPPYGAQLYEGDVDPNTGPSNRDGRINPRIGQPPDMPHYVQELPTNVYRWDPSGRLDVVINGDQVQNPNGVCFSPDFKKLYVVGSPGVVHVFDVTPDNKCVNQQLFSDFMVNGIRCGPDGVRCDVFGNVWASSNAGRNVGYSGVTCWSPGGTLLGRIRIPEVVGNITFGGPKRNRIFMAASQSLYAVYTNTQGAGPS